VQKKISIEKQVEKEMHKNGLVMKDACDRDKLPRSGEIYDKTKSGQLRRPGRNRIKTERMMMIIL